MPSPARTAPTSGRNAPGIRQALGESEATVKPTLLGTAATRIARAVPPKRYRRGAFEAVWGGQPPMALGLGRLPRILEGGMMKAIVQHEYGAPSDVLRLAEVDTPAVGEQEVLVRVQASSANPWDWHFIRGEPVLMRPAGIGGIRKPRFLIPGETWPARSSR